MTQPSPDAPSVWWQQIVGEDLSAVSFIRDYVRFEFNPPPMIDALTKTVITTPSGSATLGDRDFANLAIGLIGTVVAGVTVAEGQSFIIRFADGSIISISLRAEDYVAIEALVFHGPKSQIVVI
jgi:hypothetical protein